MIAQITVKEVMAGVPALVVEYDDGNTVVHDPFKVADTLDYFYGESEPVSPEETNLQIAEFLMAHLGELLRRSGTDVLVAFSHEPVGTEDEE